MTAEALSESMTGMPRANPTPTMVRTRLGEVECAEFGQGPAVLALHGAMGGYDQGHILVRTVAEPGYRFVSISRPGYLRTAISTGRSAAAQADLYAALLDALHIETTLVMAVSGGGPSSLEFALRHRDRCWGLVLVSTCGGKITERLPLAFHLLKLMARWPGLSKRAQRRVRRDPETSALRSIRDRELCARTMRDPEAGALLTELMLSTSDRMALRLPGTENDVRVTRETEYALERIDVPTLVVHGTSDRLVPFERHGLPLATRIPGARLLTIEGGEHVSIFTHRNVVRPCVVEFMRQHAPGRACS